MSVDQRIHGVRACQSRFKGPKFLTPISKKVDVLCRISWRLTNSDYLDHFEPFVITSTSPVIHSQSQTVTLSLPALFLPFIPLLFILVALFMLHIMNCHYLAFCLFWSVAFSDAQFSLSHILAKRIKSAVWGTFYSYLLSCFLLPPSSRQISEKQSLWASTWLLSFSLESEEWVLTKSLGHCSPNQPVRRNLLHQSGETHYPIFLQSD